MDWFERLTGFPEQAYDDTKRLLRTEGEHLHIHGKSQPRRVGRLELASLADLRGRLADCRKGELQFTQIFGDAGSLHRAADNQGSLFQVASQFNLLEMVSPSVTPEDGVTRYQSDRTQGPACAVAAGAATLYRNYLVPVGSQIGQTAANQIDALEDVRDALADRVGLAPAELWTMKNGYTVASDAAIQNVAEWLATTDECEPDEIRGKLRIGIHWDVEVTDAPEVGGSLVSQAFCSAIPVSYSSVPSGLWEPLARLILEAAYEATFAAAVVNQSRGASDKLYLTRLGGGAFGNPQEWIDHAITRARSLFPDFSLRVMLVEYRRS